MPVDPINGLTLLGTRAWARLSYTHVNDSIGLLNWPHDGTILLHGWVERVYVYVHYTAPQPPVSGGRGDGVLYDNLAA